VGGATGGLILGLSILKNVDQGWIEELGGQGAIRALSHIASKVDYTFFSGIKMYLFSFFILVFVFLYYF
jgi:NADH dehydrogenase subunit 5 C-terminus